MGIFIEIDALKRKWFSKVGLEVLNKLVTAALAPGF